MSSESIRPVAAISRTRRVLHTAVQGVGILGALIAVCGLLPAIATSSPAVSAGQEFSCSVAEDGLTRCWGMNISKELGNAGAGLSSDTPVLVGSLASDEVRALSSGTFYTCALIATGSVKCWGDNEGNQLGSATCVSAGPVLGCGTSISADPVQDLGGVSQISSGHLHACAVGAAGQPLCWGSDFSGQFGDGRTTIDGVPTPTRPTGLGSVVSIAAGNFHTCAVATDGTVYCAGDWGAGQESLTPTAIGLSGASVVGAGERFSCAIIAANGSVACWGDNSFGQLGNGTTTESAQPVPVTGIGGATALSLGTNHACAIVAGGQVRCWGRSSGIVGDADTTTKLGHPEDGSPGFGLTPVTVVDASGRPITGIVAIGSGLAHSCGITADYTTWCWGSNSEGQLGNTESVNARGTDHAVLVSGLSVSTPTRPRSTRTPACVANTQLLGASEPIQAAALTRSPGSPVRLTASVTLGSVNWCSTGRATATASPPSVDQPGLIVQSTAPGGPLRSWDYRFSDLTWHPQPAVGTDSSQLIGASVSPTIDLSRVWGSDPSVTLQLVSFSAPKESFGLRAPPTALEVSLGAALDVGVEVRPEDFISTAVSYALTGQGVSTVIAQLADGLTTQLRSLEKQYGIGLSAARARGDFIAISGALERGLPTSVKDSLLSVESATRLSRSQVAYVLAIPVVTGIASRLATARAATLIRAGRVAWVAKVDKATPWVLRLVRRSPVGTFAPAEKASDPPNDSAPKGSDGLARGPVFGSPALTVRVARVRVRHLVRAHLPARRKISGVATKVLTSITRTRIRPLVVSRGRFRAGGWIQVFAGGLPQGRPHAAILTLQGPGYRARALVVVRRGFAGASLRLPAHLRQGTWAIGLADISRLRKSKAGMTGTTELRLGVFKPGRRL